ncbi:hypothetical protein [Candidatus Methylocalor cossyra]|uniref:Uncharacterized protein n=1 Tax=Candidatus Methylocalor cossyra TaxID=3108543 RepID=A0ABM9NIY5_9GAMM
MGGLMRDQLFWRILAETGRPPYFGGAGIGLLQALYRATGPWPAALCLDDPASPVADWLKTHTDSVLFFYPKPASNRSLRTAPQGVWDSGTVPTVIGEEEGEFLDVAGIAFGFGVEPIFYRQRSLDDWLGEGPRLGLVHLGGLAGAARVVRGGRRLLQRCAPPVLVVRDSPAAAEATRAELMALAEELSRIGYTLYDTLLNPCPTADALHALLDLWQETVFLGLPPGHDLGALLRGLCAYPGRPDDGAEAPVRIRAEHIVDCQGFYPAERWEELQWRWSGPLPEASLRVPIPRPGHYRLSLRLLRVADDRVLDSLRLFVNGAVVAHQVTRYEYSIVIETEFPVTAARFSPIAEIRFAHGETYCINAEDPRRLGLALMDLTLERQAQWPSTA